MRNLEEYFEECKRELDAIGVKYGTVTEITVNTRAKSRWGQCRRYPNGTYTINIRDILLTDEASEKGLKETILHELLHTCKGCMKHTGEWKRLAELVNDCYGYHIKRTDCAEDKGIDGTEYIKNKRMGAKYKFVCTGCGQEIYKYRASDFVKNTWRYQCGICHSKFKQVAA